MINQGFQNQRLLPNPGMPGRFPGQAPVAEEQMWLQPRTGPFAVKPAPDVQLLQSQQLYNNNVAFKPNTLQANLQYVTESDFGRQSAGFLQPQAAQAPISQFNAGANVQGLLGNGGAPSWQSVQQSSLQQQQPQQAFNSQLFLQQQQQQQQQQQLNQLTAASLNAANMQARNAQMAHASHLAMQGQFVNGNGSFMGGMKPSVLPAQQRMAMPMQQAARLPANRPAAQVPLGALGNGFGGVGNQGLGGGGGMVGQMNAMMGGVGMPAAVAMRQQHQQQLHRASFQQLPPTSLAFQAAPMATTTSMMMDNQAALLRLQQQHHHHQQQQAALQQQQQQQKAVDFGMLAADQRGLAAGISMADVNGYGAPLRAAGARVPHLAQHPHQQAMMAPAALPAANYGALPRRYDAQPSLAPNGLHAAALAAHLPNGGALPVGANPIARPVGPQAHYRAAPAMDALHAGIVGGGGGGMVVGGGTGGGGLNGMSAAPGAGRASPSSLASHAPAAFAPPKTIITDAQVAEGLAAAEEVAKAGPPVENMDVYRCVGETFARMGITVEQALDKGLLSHMNQLQVNAVREACAAELAKMAGAQVPRRSPTPAAADGARGLVPPQQPPLQLHAASAPAALQPVGHLGGAPTSAALVAAAGSGVIGPVQPPAHAVAPQAAEALAPAAPVAPAAQQDAVVPAPAPGQQAPVAKDAAPAANGKPAAAVEAPAPSAGSDGNVAPAAPEAAAGGVFDAFGYGFFACAPVEGGEGDGLLEALEPDGGLGDELDAVLPEGDEELLKEGGDEGDAEALVDRNPEWSSGASAAGELSGQSSGGEVLSAKLSHLDLGVGFA